METGGTTRFNSHATIRTIIERTLECWECNRTICVLGSPTASHGLVPPLKKELRSFQCKLNAQKYTTPPGVERRWKEGRGDGRGRERKPQGKIQGSPPPPPPPPPHLIEDFAYFAPPPQKKKKKRKKSAGIPFENSGSAPRREYEGDGMDKARLIHSSPRPLPQTGSSRGEGARQRTAGAGGGDEVEQSPKGEHHVGREE